MGRPGITYDQVGAIADTLKAEGVGPTLQSVRERLGDTGSMNTIQRHLKAWRANQPKEAAPPVELPAEVARSMNAWVVQASTASRAEAETEMLRAQAETDLLSKHGAQLESEREQLLDEAIRLTTERDQAAALAKERAEELERMVRDLERERQVANAAQIETAASQLRLEAQAQQLVDLKADVVRLNGALDAERQARGQADTKAAVLEAELSAARREIESARDHADGLQDKLDKAQEDIQAMRDAHESHMRDIDRAAREAVAAERVATDKARDAFQSLTAEYAEMKARLAVAQEKVERLEKANAQREAKS